MSITIFDAATGLSRTCDTEGCQNNATSAWSTGVIAGGASAGQRYACDQHNPIRFTGSPLPWGFTSASLCHACGQPVRLGA